MTIDELKSWISRYIQSKRKIDDITEQIQRWTSRREKMGGSIIPMPEGGSGAGTLMECATEEIAELVNQRDQWEWFAEKSKAEIIEKINALPNSKLTAILYLKYISDKSFLSIAQEMLISKTHAINLHNEALDLMLDK